MAGSSAYASSPEQRPASKLAPLQPAARRHHHHSHRGAASASRTSEDDARATSSPSSSTGAQQARAAQAAIGTRAGRSESFYLASASGSQTDADETTAGESDSDSQSDFEPLPAPLQRAMHLTVPESSKSTSLVEPVHPGTSSPVAFSSGGSPHPFGRREPLLVERRNSPSTSTAGARSATPTRHAGAAASTSAGATGPAVSRESSPWDGLRNGTSSWGAALIDALDGGRHHHHHEYMSAGPSTGGSGSRRKMSPNVAAHRSRSPLPSKQQRREAAHSSRGSAQSVPAGSSTASGALAGTANSVSGGNGRAATREQQQRRMSHSPSPELTIDSIQSNFNPFPLYHMRWPLLTELALLEFAFALALFRLKSIANSFPTTEDGGDQPTPLLSDMGGINAPLALMAVLGAALPALVLIRRSTSYWMVPFTDARAYRAANTADDGLATAIILPILLAASCLWDTFRDASSGNLSFGLERTHALTGVWEASGIHSLAASAPSPLDFARVLLDARRALVILTSINSAILYAHLFISRWVFRIERVSTSNAKRFFASMALAGSLSAVLWLVVVFVQLATPLELPLSALEVACSGFIQQASFYIVSRLARRGFSLGELAILTAAGNSLCLEFWRLTRARWRYPRTAAMVIPPTFRYPTPIVVFQSVLIPGAFLSGFLLSPLLVISRHIAQKPSHRLRWPTERERHRKLLAAGVFLGLFGIVFLLLGGWCGWMLGHGQPFRRPWLWALDFIFKGSDGVARTRVWPRWILLAYWGTTVSSAIGGWQTRFSRARSRIRPPPRTDNAKPGTQPDQQKVQSASLNMRRKFFHALATALFVPGIAIDPAFTSLAFSVAFAIFTFAEYARYFALYPIGASLHIFFSEFVDSRDKDSGPVILSHFYLLTGCAGGLWLEGGGIKRFTGVLAIGVGDALASIMGKLFGRTRWASLIGGDSNKTVEGSAVFVISIVFCAWLMRLVRVVDSFSLARYTLATSLTALLEASSRQNDNVVIPLYMWSLQSLLNV